MIIRLASSTALRISSFYLKVQAISNYSNLFNLNTYALHLLSALSTIVILSELLLVITLSLSFHSPLFCFEFILYN